jgi:hypothetical protein
LQAARPTSLLLVVVVVVVGFFSLCFFAAASFCCASYLFCWLVSFRCFFFHGSLLGWFHIFAFGCKSLFTSISPFLGVAAGLAAEKNNWACRSYPERNPNRHDDQRA